jgi:hypothetical protein
MTQNKDSWQKATIGAMGALLLLFLSYFITSAYAMASQVQVNTTEIAVVKQSIQNQEKLLTAILEELRRIRENDTGTTKPSSR